METRTIEFTEATIESISGHPADPEPTTVLVLSAPLTVALADALKCRDMCFTLNDNARQFEGKFTLPLELGDNESEIRFPVGVGTWRPFKVWKFRIGHETDLKLGVEFRSHFKGAAEAQAINDLLQTVNKDDFTVALVSLQGELFAEKPAGDGEGTKVNMSPEEDPGTPLFPKPKKESTGCKSCDAQIPLKEGDDAEHVNGEPCKLWDKNNEPPLSAGAAPTAAEKKKARLAEEEKKRALREQSGVVQ